MQHRLPEQVFACTLALLGKIKEAGEVSNRLLYKGANCVAESGSPKCSATRQALHQLPKKMAARGCRSRPHANCPRPQTFHRRYHCAHPAPLAPSFHSRVACMCWSLTALMHTDGLRRSSVDELVMCMTTFHGNLGMEGLSRDCIAKCWHGIPLGVRRTSRLLDSNLLLQFQVPL